MRDMRELSREECLDLLRGTPVGRLVFTENALPAIRPVNFSVDGEDIVITTAARSAISKLDATVVAFEIDSIDEATHSGWSVVVLGWAKLVDDVDEQAMLDGSTRPSWDPAARGTFLRIPMRIVTGRRLSRFET